jgi:hypothetical protein
MRSFVRAALQRPWLALLVALLLEIIVFVFGQRDFVASDPLWYADIAHSFSNDLSMMFTNHDTHPFMMRIGLTAPLALLYRIFGVSPRVSNLPCLLAALGIVAVVYSAAPTPRMKWLAMGFASTCVPLLNGAGVLGVDLPCTALMACSVLCLSRRDRPRGAWWLVAAVVSLVAAFLVKETAVWSGIVWVYALICDLRSIGVSATVRRFAPALGVGAALGAGYLVLCSLAWGDALARFHGVEELTYEHAWTLHGQSAATWLRRLTWQPPVLLARMFGATLLPAVVAGFWVRGAERIWWFSTAAFGLLYWFGSTSPFSYSPLPILDRMVLPVLPGILVLATLASDRALDRWSGSRWGRLGLAGLAVAVAVPGLIEISAAFVRPAPETASFAAVRAEAADPKVRIVMVCGEPRCVSVSGIYLGYERAPNLTVEMASDFARAPLPEHASVRALVNLGRARTERIADPEYDQTGPIEALALPVIVRSPHVRLYDAGDGTRLWNALQARAPTPR